MLDTPKELKKAAALKLSNGEDPSLYPRVQFRTASTVHSLALNATGTTLAVGTSEHTEVYRIIMQRDPKFPDAPPSYFCEPLLLLECPALQGGVAFSQNEQIAIGGNQLVSVFDLDTGGMLVKMEREDRVRCVALSADGECLVIGGFDKMVRMQMIERGTEVRNHAGSWVSCRTRSAVAAPLPPAPMSSLLAW